MKNKFKWAIIQLIILLIFGACTEDFFNEIPSDRITPDQHYKSMMEAEISTKAPLAILRDVVPQMIFTNELLADLTTLNDNVDLDWQDINNHNISKDNPYIDPSGFYKVVINVNESLLYIDSIAKMDQDITELDIKIFKGNLIGIRSWAYFTLARLYGEVALLKDNMPELTKELNYLPRTVILDTLINQLLPYLDIDYLDDNQNPLIYTMYNKALIGEIFLEKQDYQNAATYLQMAIEGFEDDKYIYKVTKDYSKTSWAEIFVNSSYQKNEVMVAVPFSFTEGQSNPIEKWYGYNYDFIAKPTHIITNLFEKQNNNKGDEYRGNGISYFTFEDISFVTKYSLEVEDFNSDLIIYRAADIHLLLAEALNRTGFSDIALAILNDGYNEYTNWGYNMGVRGRVYLDPVTIPDDVDMVNYVEDMILEERAMELAFEGKRWFDLMRVARRRGNSYLANRVAAKFSETSAANKIKEQLNKEENWYLPFSK